MWIFNYVIVAQEFLLIIYLQYLHFIYGGTTVINH